MNYILDRYIYGIYFILIFILSTIFIPIIFIIIKPFIYIINKIFKTSIKLDWDTNCKLFIYYLCGVRSNINNKENIIDNGYILCNHRCWFDLAYDPYITKASVVGRKQAFWLVSFSYILCKLDNRAISFTRGNTNRTSLFKLIKENLLKKKRIMYYPEGTRLSYKELNTIEEVKKILKPGLLKSIYEDNTQLPVQLCISHNKDNVINEKKLYFKYGITINTEFSKKIDPRTYTTFDEFYNDICTHWFKISNKLNKL